MNNGCKRKILLVEDEVILAMSQKMSLEKYGYDVTSVTTGEKAVEFIENNPEIDLILMDIDLGKGIDGPQAAEMILKNHDLPLVFVSSHTEQEIVEKTEKITSYGYVVKSSSITVLDASIKMAFKLFDAKIHERENEKSLCESEESLSITLQSIGDAVISTNIIGQIVRMNPVAEKLTGWTLIEAKGKLINEVFNIVNVQTRQNVVNPVKLVIESGTIVGLANHTILISKNGVEYQIADSGAPIKNKFGEIVGVVLVFRDVTTEYKMQEMLKASEEKFRFLSDIAPFSVSISNELTGEIEYINNKAIQIFGYSLEDIPNTEVWFEKVYPDVVYRDQIKRTWENAYHTNINNNNGVFYESIIKSKDGLEKKIQWQTFWMNNKYFTFGFSLDI